MGANAKSTPRFVPHTGLPMQKYPRDFLWILYLSDVTTEYYSAKSRDCKNLWVVGGGCLRTDQAENNIQNNNSFQEICY